MTAKRGTEDNPQTIVGKIGGLIKELLIVVVGALIIAFLIRTFLGQMFLIPSESMQHTLDVNDRIAVQKVTHFKRGDVVVFKDPDNWLGDEQQAPERGPIGKALEFIGVLPDSSNEYLVKRVIGMPGDHVVCCDNQDRITVNGQPLDERRYIYSQDGQQSKPSNNPFNVIVPRDRLWVMGDHRDDSADSRCHLPGESASSTAFVPEDDVVGPAFAIVAPFDRAKWLHTPETFAHVPAAHGPAPAKPVINSHNNACG